MIFSNFACFLNWIFSLALAKSRWIVLPASGTGAGGGTGGVGAGAGDTGAGAGSTGLIGSGAGSDGGAGTAGVSIGASTGSTGASTAGGVVLISVSSIIKILIKNFSSDLQERRKLHGIPPFLKN